MEKLYHYLWKNKIKGNFLRDIDGLEIEIIDPGIHNLDAGPDFFNAKLKIEGVEWIGNVEIHVKASDWYRHGHEEDPAYDNVILHVVGISDKRITREDGTLLPQVEFTFPESFYRILADLSTQTDNVRCASYLSALPKLTVTDWLETLSIERLQQKSTRILEIRKQTGGDWEQTCFILLARGLGFGLNGDPFEQLAKSLPLKLLHHHSDNLMQLEALLFGQAAMLDPSLYMFDEYFQLLCREYYFLSKKYSLRPIHPGQWKYSRTRPHNFPHRRIALLAGTAYGGFSLFTRLLESVRDLDRLLDVFDLHAEGYWETHYSFDGCSGMVPKELSASSKSLLAINVAIPLLYAYAAITGNFELGEKAAGMMYELKPENNSYVRQWKTLGIGAKDASASQALIHLRKEYCDKGKCMFCRFGNKLLRKAGAEVS